MNKLASLTLDVVDHIINDDLEKLAETVQDLSEDARTTYVPSYEERESMDESNFGLILWHPNLGKFNKFATDSSGLVEINMALLASKMKDLPDEIIKIAAANLTCAAKNFGVQIPKDLEKFASTEYVYNTLDIRTIDEAKFIVKTSEIEEPKTYAVLGDNKYPLDNKKDILKAATYFKKHHNKFSPLAKLAFALDVVNAAKNNDIAISKSEVEKYASINTDEFNVDLKDHIAVRQSYLKDDESDIFEIYDELLEKSAELGPNRTASALYELDKKLGLTDSYGKGIEDSIISVFALTKEAGTDIDGHFVTNNQLKNIPSGELTAIVGNDVIPELKGEEGLEVLASLPRPIRQEVLDLI